MTDDTGTEKRLPTMADVVPPERIDPGMFRVRRVGDFRVTSLPVSRGDRYDNVPLDEAKDEFKLDAVAASAAVATGHFEMVENAKTRLKAK